MPKYRKRRAKKRTYKKKARGARVRCKALSETKIMKSIIPADANITWTTPLIFHSPYTRSLRLGYNFSITRNGNSAEDVNIKQFIPNGFGYEERIGRQVTIMGATNHLILAVEHNGTTVQPWGLPFYPRKANVRIVQGWCKEGVNGLMALKAGVPTLYSEFNWNSYKIMKDYIVTRKGTYSGLNQQGYPLKPGNVDDTGGNDQAGVAVPTYDDIVIRSSWRPNKVLKFSGDSGAAGGTTGAGGEYHGWAPFLMIFNAENAHIQLRMKFNKRVIAFKDL